MKKSLFVLLLSAALFVVGCKVYDDTELKGKVDNLETRVTNLENALQSQVEALKALIDKKADGIAIESVTPYLVEGVVKGYTVLYTDGSKYTIVCGDKGEPGKDGLDGNDGLTPTVYQGADGEYYWAIGTTPLLDGNGDPIPVTGQPLVPQFLVYQGSLYYSFDGFETAANAGKVAVELESIVKDVVVDDPEVGFVSFYLNDEAGTVVTLPMEKPFGLEFKELAGLGIVAGATIPIEYTLNGGDAETVVDVMANNGYEAVVVPDAEGKGGVVNVTAPDPVVSGKVLVFADNGKGKTSIKALTFEAEATSVVVKEADVTAIATLGEEVKLEVTSNMEYKVVIEETAQSWIHVKLPTKATTTSTVELIVDANTTGVPRDGQVDIVALDGKSVLETIILHQEAADPVVLNGEKSFATIQEAITEAAKLEAGAAAVITLAPGEYAEHVLIDKVAANITIEGASAEEVSILSIEVLKTAVTLKNLTLKPVGEYTPTLEEVSGGYKYPFGLYVFRAGYGVVLDGVTLYMKDAHANTTGLFFVNNDPADVGPYRDAIRNCVLGEKEADYTRRNAQIYGAHMDIVDNVISTGHRDYAIRIGGNVACDVKISGNKFYNSYAPIANKGAGFAIDFYALVQSNVVLGENECDDTFTALYGSTTASTDGDPTAAEKGNTFTPAMQLADGGVLVPKTAEFPYAYRADDSWWATEPLPGVAGDWNRSVAMSSKYVFMPRQKGGETNIYYFEIMKPWIVKELDMTKVVVGASTHTVSGCQVIKDGDKESLLVCNLRLNETQTFRVYKYDDVEAPAEVVLEYVNDGGGLRIGDKMTFNGTWQDGEIVLVNYFNYGAAYIFKVENGVVNPVPVVTNPVLNAIKEKVGVEYAGTNMAHLVKFGQNEYLFADRSFANAPAVLTLDGETFTCEGNWNIGRNAAVVRFFTLEGKDYMAMLSRQASSNTAGYDIFIVPIDSSKSLYENLSGKTLDDAAKVPVIDTPTAANGNGTADIAVQIIDGKAYVAVLVTNNLVSVFQFDGIEIATGSVTGPGDATIVPGGDF